MKELATKVVNLTHTKRDDFFQEFHRYFNFSLLDFSFQFFFYILLHHFSLLFEKKFLYQMFSWFFGCFVPMRWMYIKIHHLMTDFSAMCFVVAVWHREKKPKKNVHKIFFQFSEQLFIFLSQQKNIQIEKSSPTRKYKQLPCMFSLVSLFLRLHIHEIAMYFFCLFGCIFIFSCVCICVCVCTSLRKTGCVRKKERVSE